MPATRIVIMGLDPALVPEGDAAYAAVPGMTGEAIMQVLTRNRERLEALGFETEVCAVNAGPSVEEAVAACLGRFRFDGVVVGGGIRLPPANTLLLERLVNAVREQAPWARFCFNTGPLDTVEAVLRVFPMQATGDGDGAGTPS